MNACQCHTVTPEVPTSVNVRLIPSQTFSWIRSLGDGTKPHIPYDYIPACSDEYRQCQALQGGHRVLSSVKPEAGWSYSSNFNTEDNEI